MKAHIVMLLFLLFGLLSAPAAQSQIPRMPGALLIQDDDFNTRELTLDGKLGPALFDIVQSSGDVRARPGGNDFLFSEDDTCCLEIELARPGGDPVVVSRGV